MQQHHDDDNGWVKDAERWICQLQSVRQCKIDLDIHGDITGIHVVASMEREPRLIVRDVEGLLKARLDLSVYYKKISVVQVLEPLVESADVGKPADASAVSPAQPPTATPVVESAAEPLVEPTPQPRPVQSQTPKPAMFGDAAVLSANPWPLGGHDSRPALLLEEAPMARVECTGVGVMVSGASLTASVELMRGDASAKGRETGSNHASVDLQLLARATVTALSALIDEPVILSVSDIRETETAGETVVIAAVDLVEGRRSERFFGVCSLAQGRQQAAVYAVLDALNRRLELMSFKEADLD